MTKRYLVLLLLASVTQISTANAILPVENVSGSAPSSSNANSTHISCAVGLEGLGDELAIEGDQIVPKAGENAEPADAERLRFNSDSDSVNWTNVVQLLSDSESDQFRLANAFLWLQRSWPQSIVDECESMLYLDSAPEQRKALYMITAMPAKQIKQKWSEQIKKLMVSGEPPELRVHAITVATAKFSDLSSFIEEIKKAANESSHPKLKEAAENSLRWTTIYSELQSSNEAVKASALEWIEKQPVWPDSFVDKMGGMFVGHNQKTALKLARVAPQPTTWKLSTLFGSLRDSRVPSEELIQNSIELIKQVGRSEFPTVSDLEAVGAFVVHPTRGDLDFHAQHISKRIFQKRMSRLAKEAVEKDAFIALININNLTYTFKAMQNLQNDARVYNSNDFNMYNANRDQAWVKGIIRNLREKARAIKQDQTLEQRQRTSLSFKLYQAIRQFERQVFGQ